MKKIIIGKKEENTKYDFRETCFGINTHNNQVLVIFDKNQYSLIGGGKDKEETHKQCLIREFAEDVGYSIKNIEHLFTIDCFCFAEGKWPLESLANFYYVELDQEINQSCEAKIEYIDYNEALNIITLPYQKKALELFKENVSR